MSHVQCNADQRTSSFTHSTIIWVQGDVPMYYCQLPGFSKIPLSCTSAWQAAVPSIVLQYVVENYIVTLLSVNSCLLIQWSLQCYSLSKYRSINIPSLSDSCLPMWVMVQFFIQVHLFTLINIWVGVVMGPSECFCCLSHYFRTLLLAWDRPCSIRLWRMVVWLSCSTPWFVNVMYE